jgi:hypothetical protein
MGGLQMHVHILFRKSARKRPSGIPRHRREDLNLMSERAKLIQPSRRSSDGSI